MLKKLYLIKILTGLCFPLILNCTPPVEPPPLVPPSLSEIVVESMVGAPVSGALVSVSGTILAAVTDSLGAFTFDTIAAGTYDLLIAENGMAGSKMQAVQVNANGPMNVQILEPGYSTTSTLLTPPTITVSGIAKDGTYAGSVPITVNAEPGSSATPIVGTGGHYSLYLKIDSTAGLLPDAQSTTNTLSYTWNTLLYPPGNLNIKIVAYDNNNNRSELNIPVTVGPRSGTPPTFAPTAYVWGE